MDDLSIIANSFITDKGPCHHNYTPIYDKYFSQYRDKEFTFIEAGIGGYHYSDRGGGSLQMWRKYFSLARIIGFDIYDKSRLNIPGVELYQGSQTDRTFLESLENPFIFIDDASHKSDLTIQTFEIMFPRLHSGGIYVVEDAHVSYWDGDWIGSISVIEYFKKKIDDIHLIPGQDIESIHFYNKLVFVFKSR